MIAPIISNDTPNAVMLISYAPLPAVYGRQLLRRESATAPSAERARTRVPLDPEHRRVGGAEQAVVVVGVDREHRAADARPEVELVAVDHKRLGQCGGQTVGDLLGVHRRGLRSDQPRELVPAEASDGVLAA